MKTSENIMTNKPKTISNNVVHNFDLSIIMSFYKRYKEFARVLPINAKYLQRNGIEVVIAMDEPSERQKLIELLKQYPFINWKLIVNDKKHKPRNHAPVLNVALKHATKKYIMQIDPEVEMFTDIIFQMRSLLEHYPKHYALAEMAYIPFDKKITKAKDYKEVYSKKIGYIDNLNVNGNEFIYEDKKDLLELIKEHKLGNFKTKKEKKIDNIGGGTIFYFMPLQNKVYMNDGEFIKEVNYIKEEEKNLYKVDKNKQYINRAFYINEK